MNKKSPDLALGPPIKFYNGDITLKFSERDHIYYLVGQDDSLTVVDGVTTVCKIIDKSYYLMSWACKVMAAKLVQTIPRFSDILAGDFTESIPLEEFVRLTDEAKSAHKERLEDAGDVGTEAHRWLDNFIQDAVAYQEGYAYKLDTHPLPEEPRAKKCVEAALDWMGEHKVKWLRTEQKVFSREYLYAGTLDGLAEVDGKLSLVDWKTSNAVRGEYFMQTAAYIRAMEEEHNMNIGSCWILRLGKEKGDFEDWHTGREEIEEDFTEFLLCLQLVRQNKQLEKRLAEAKKARTAQKKLEKILEKTQIV